MVITDHGPGPCATSLARVRTAAQILPTGAKIAKKPRRGTTGLKSKVDLYVWRGVTTVIVALNVRRL